MSHHPTGGTPLRRLLLALGLVAALAACETAAPVTSPAPVPRPTVTPPSAESKRLAAYYARVQARLLSQGLMRTDDGGADAYFSTRNLVENFERIALYNEYFIRDGQYVQQQTPSRLRRWEQPIRMQLVFGRSVSPAQRARDRRNVASFTRRLENLTGVDITLTDADPNFVVLFINRDEQRTMLPRLRQILPQFTDMTALDEIRHSPRDTLCSAYVMSDRPSASAYVNAVVLIKTENPDLMRLSCIHEEIAQAMGLANDSPAARPSIFNDDEEFALLTRHDELLLRILYDPRLKLGMTPESARPIVRQVAREVLGGES